VELLKDSDYCTELISRIKDAADVDIINLKGLELAKAVYSM
jgi:hypothetical protein